MLKFMYYSPLLVKCDDEKVLFWSDTHFGHLCERWDIPLWRMRGFNSVDEHDQILIERWNSVAHDDTIAFFLGDFIFGPNTIQRFEQIVRTLKFKTLHMMPGNHCSGWKQHFENNASTHGAWNLSDSKRIIFIPNYIEAVVNKQPIVMSHYPIASFNGQMKGAWMVHGHCHGKLYNSPVMNSLYKAKVVDVGIENCSSPISFAGLKNLFNERDPVSFD